MATEVAISRPTPARSTCFDNLRPIASSNGAAARRPVPHDSVHGRRPLWHDARVSFFASMPPPDEAEFEEFDEPQLPAWYGPPQHVLGGTVALDQVLVRTEHVFIGISRARGFASGVALDVTIAVRRGEWSAQRWADLDTAMWGQRHHPGSPWNADTAIRFGIELADGRRAATTRPHLHPFAGGQEPDPPVLIEGGGSGGGGPRFQDRHAELWLWPLPEGDTVDLVVAWPALEVPETRTTIGTAAIVTAAQRAQPFWPDT